ncbi:hypothetical protein [Cupriavidus taiwanensis]|uniref:hypothetical protein n=1 Tax=Cupriavidus taiwanensis TaxID=164546 RepID=UPI000E10440F|nr:hypothetical protein [Cupriavidus taiwanensis]SPA50620.1 protein of unknown function [Cupriavidus taiwanensis]
MKTCAKCGAQKPLTDFYAYGGKVKGKCKPCWSADTAARLLETPRGVANRLIAGARKRRPVTVSVEQIEAGIVRGACAVTGLPFVIGRSGTGARALAPSIDRIDPSLDYTPTNTQVVCWLYNRAKGDGSHEDVLMLAEALCPKL